MKYFIIAGEKSGDLHGGNLAKELKLQDSSCMMQGWGGSEMRSAGVELLQDYSELAFMGLDFLKHFGRIRKLFIGCKKQILSYDPDVLILIDYSGFNLRIAKWAKKNDIKVVYYIAPKTWAWNASRNKSIKKFVDRLLVILPFEESYFKEHGIETLYVGNPLVERINAFVPDTAFKDTIPEGYDSVVALLPGSRKKEIERVSEELKKVARQFKHTLFVVAAISEVEQSLYKCFECIPNSILVFDKTYDILSVADAAIVTSGTATLETALFNVPQIVVYKADKLTYFIGSRMVKIKHISLVNLILDDFAVPELIQQEFNSGMIKSHLKELLFDTKKKENQLGNYKKLKLVLGERKASKSAAVSIREFLKIEQ
ncbi:lipid-A-disaccharide synthase [Arcticibacterium luteifluviistationis]|uniref:Lipid-A-disaccharide synthase n=1 Tax=Arcticibacterium luteifluviistationis TaxID=1784714 RepID=A0A2Z4GAI2_9BACT|nr:lipid-A-disaccharide synthase [Arcticibacterium luteifluviistationis]AWV98100.1 lipid-A-disaccharide synthase [Arcticibacterium luteifluviistationis]